MQRSRQHLFILIAKWRRYIHRSHGLCISDVHSHQILYLPTTKLFLNHTPQTRTPLQIPQTLRAGSPAPSRIPERATRPRSRTLRQTHPKTETRRRRSLPRRDPGAKKTATSHRIPRPPRRRRRQKRARPPQATRPPRAGPQGHRTGPGRQRPAAGSRAGYPVSRTYRQTARAERTRGPLRRNPSPAPRALSSPHNAQIHAPALQGTHPHHPGPAARSRDPRRENRAYGCAGQGVPVPATGILLLAAALGVGARAVRPLCGREGKLAGPRRRERDAAIPRQHAAPLSEIRDRGAAG